MSGPEKKDESGENVFKIMDGIIDQLNRTKRTFILMVITIMVVIPLTFAVTSAVIDRPFPGHRPPWGPDGFERPEPPNFWLVRIIPFAIALIWLGVGIRQWLVLNKWTKKYEHYKELQKKLDEKLGDEDEEKNGSSPT
ncbi:MAG: hypothetical protein QXJ74_06995 [Nitrososphaera sp.]|uniref:hypothetical protein n=1 Tax=Nitrososphaera sp. TaxID=1971748 RepID=UPI0017E39300|nr:hypothetical protein [Nitrososphaera sp.]NWG38016.1 hypothetical protein [Nitrososphaera sp.]